MSIKTTILRILRQQSPEQYQIIEAVGAFRELVTPSSPTEQTTIDEVLSASRSVIARNPNPSRKLLTELGWSPLDAAALFVLKSCRTELESGRRHVCPGILMEDGRTYRWVFDACIDHLSKEGRYDRIRAEDEREALDDAIQRAG